MPDISMCKGEGDKKKQCYRFMAIPSDIWQSWFAESPIDKETNECEAFWEAKGKTRLRKLDAIHGD